MPSNGGKRYRYYVSRSLITDPGRTSEPSLGDCQPLNWNGSSLKQIGEFLADQNRIWALCKEAKLSHHESVAALKRANQLAQDLRRGSDSSQRPLLLHLIKRIVVRADRIVMELSRVGLLKQLCEGDAAESRAKKDDRTIVLTVPCQFRRRGMEMRLVIGDRSGAEGRPDATLIAALVRAHAWWQELCSGNSRSIKHIADREGSDERYVARNLKLAFLAPDITAAILEGQPAGRSHRGHADQNAGFASFLGSATTAVRHLASKFCSRSINQPLTFLFGATYKVGNEERRPAMRLSKHMNSRINQRAIGKAMVDLAAQPGTRRARQICARPPRGRSALGRNQPRARVASENPR